MWPSTAIAAAASSPSDPDAPVGEVVHVCVMFDPRLKAQVEGRPSPKPRP
jgi:hypothetical protein